MFDELSAGAEDSEDRLSKLGPASIRIRRTGQPEDAGFLQADNHSAAARKGTPIQLQPVSSGPTASVSTLQASRLVEKVDFDLTPANLTRWQHRDKYLVKSTPEDGPAVSDPQWLPMLTFNHHVRKGIYQVLRQQIR